MSIKRIKKLSVSFLIMATMVITSVLVASAAYTQGTVNLNGGWWNGKYTTAGSGSKPSYGTFTTTSVSTGVSFSALANNIADNVITGRGTISQYGMVLHNGNITKHNYVGNRVTYAEWMGSPTSVYGQ